MFSSDSTECSFYQFALELFLRAGHAINQSPVYYNHSINEVLYFDSVVDISLSQEERNTLFSATHISCLFQLDDTVFTSQSGETIAFYSVVLSANQSSRSQLGHDIHSSLHQFMNCTYSIILFNLDESFMLSFADSDSNIVLSNWYSLSRDFELVMQTIDIGNMTLISVKEYFVDFVYSIARWYYLNDISPEYAAYELFQINYFSSLETAVDASINKDEIKEIIRSIMCLAEIEYGDDYVEHRIKTTPSFDIGAGIDLISFELELPGYDSLTEQIDEVDGNSELRDDETLDEYGYDDVDPEIFRDPTLLVKWLKMNSK